MDVFLVAGNKRSGTTLLSLLLNEHPRVFCSRESDVAYILYSMAMNEELDPHCTDPWSFSYINAHPCDDDNGMRWTLRTCAEMFAETGRSDPKGTFVRVQERLMEMGNHVQEQYRKPFLDLIGDKKPVQYADPEVRQWLDDVLQPKYLHIVRHPQACISSMHELGMIHWWQGDLESLERQWVDHERWALSIPGDRRHTFRYEDLVQSPRRTMAKVFEFLSRPMPIGVGGRMESIVHPKSHGNRTLIDLPYSEPVLELMERYDYSKEFIP